MNRIINTSLVLAITLTTLACKSTKKNPKTDVVEEVKENGQLQEPAVLVTYADPVQQKAHEEKAEAPPKVEEPIKIVYALNVSFYSIGEGTDGAAINSFKQYLETFNKSEQVSLAYEMNAWGREGEVDYCFMLEELSGKQRDKFISGAKKLFTEKNLVHLNENGQCHPKRR